jgi:hypothetical protein
VHAPGRGRVLSGHGSIPFDHQGAPCAALSADRDLALDDDPLCMRAALRWHRHLAGIAQVPHHGAAADEQLCADLLVGSSPGGPAGRSPPLPESGRCGYRRCACAPSRRSPGALAARSAQASAPIDASASNADRSWLRASVPRPRPGPRRHGPSPRPVRPRPARPRATRRAAAGRKARWPLWSPGRRAHAPSARPPPSTARWPGRGSRRDRGVLSKSHISPGNLNRRLRIKATYFL